MAKYLYDRGDGRFKHCWNKPYAGFEPGRRGPVGKCSSKINQEVAQQLLDDGIQWKANEDDLYPEAIYNIFEGVPYEAAPTLAGVSYHGYPWRGRMPLKVLRQLKARAEQCGQLRAFKDWLSEYESKR